MPLEDDRECFVDSSSNDASGFSEPPSYSDGHSSPDTKANNTKKSICRDFGSTASQLHLIYISIAACLAAISIALIITIFFGSPQVTPHGFIISESGFCSETGKKIMMQSGGNAVDALTSIVLCLTVTRPDIISLGGCGAFWVHKRDTNNNDLFDAMCTSPIDFNRDKTNPSRTVGVPGLIAGLKSLHETHGYLNWADLFQPAIELTQNGFPVHPDLLKRLKKVADSQSLPASSFAVSFLKSVNNGTYGPQPVLEKTLRRLAAEGPLVFYNGSIGLSVLTEMEKHNVSWQMNGDLGAYQVQKSKEIELGLAGFNVYAFPSPFVGGTLTAMVLANLDLLNHYRPLNARKLGAGEAKELALVYHRLIELTKLGVGQVSLLGDPHDLTIGENVVDQENSILRLENRQLISGIVKDDRVLNVTECGNVDPVLFRHQDTNTFVLTVESDMFIVAASLTLGGTFGSGVVVPETGILLNSAQNFFSSLEKSSANSPAPGRRPLLSFSPVFFETAQQRCGHRFVAASSGGLQGMIGLLQMLTSSFLHLSDVKCIDDENGPKSNNLPPVDETTATYTPAVGSCLPLNDSLDLKRFSLDLRQGTNGTEFVVLLEQGFNPSVGEELRKIGHVVEIAAEDSEEVEAGAVGWTLYTTIGGVKKLAVNSSSWF